MPSSRLILNFVMCACLAGLGFLVLNEESMPPRAPSTEPRLELVDVDAAILDEGFRAGLPDVAGEALRGVGFSEARSSFMASGELSGLLRPGVAAAPVKRASLAVAELCRDNLRAQACRAYDGARRRVEARLRAAFRLDQAFRTATAPDVDTSTPDARAPECGDRTPCGLSLTAGGGLVVNVGYHPEDTMPDGVSVAIPPSRMVGSVMVKTYR